MTTDRKFPRQGSEFPEEASVPPRLYQNVIDRVIDRIASGALAPGAMLPSEPMLGEEFGVSQGTARKALIELERRGIVTRHQGRGTFVTVRTPESALFHFFRLRKADGTQIIPRLESETVRKRRARSAEAGILHGTPSTVIEILRVRSIEGAKVVFECSVMPAELFPGLVERAPLPNTLYALFQQAYSCAIVRAEERLGATTAGAEVAAALEVAEGTAVLVSERRAIDLSDRVVELRRSSYLTDDLRYTITLT